MSDYRPISCAAYDELEIMAMHRAEVELWFESDTHTETQSNGRVVDTAIHDGAEFLVLETGHGRQEIRIDRILRIHNPTTGERWRQKPDG